MDRVPSHGSITHAVIISLSVCLSPAIYAKSPTDREVGELSGTLQTSERRQRQCTILVTDQGFRYQVIGLDNVAHGARATLTGLVSPMQRPVCGVPLQLTVTGDNPVFQSAQVPRSGRQRIATTEKDQRPNKKMKPGQPGAVLMESHLHIK